MIVNDHCHHQFLRMNVKTSWTLSSSTLSNDYENVYNDIIINPWELRCKCLRWYYHQFLRMTMKTLWAFVRSCHWLFAMIVNDYRSLHFLITHVQMFEMMLSSFIMNRCKNIMDIHQKLILIICNDYQWSLLFAFLDNSRTNA